MMTPCLPAYNFSGRRVIVTGAASGIGAAVAALFHTAGADVLAADLAFSAAAPTANSCPRLIRAGYDAADPQAATALVDQAMQAFGGIDHLVLCAGIYETQSLTGMADDQWRRMMGVNLDGVFYLVSRAAPVMTAGGSIVALASVAAHQGGSLHHAHYGASKGGVLAFMRGLARDLAPQLRVNAVSPGTIDTPMVAQRLAAGGMGNLSHIPAGRLGQPGDIAQACAWLCSDGAAYVTGETLLVAGGLYMG